jgi:hypothetical protein
MRKEVSGMFSLAVLETENEKIAAAIARVFKKNSGKNNISVLILSSDRYAFFKRVSLICWLYRRMRG